MSKKKVRVTMRATEEFEKILEVDDDDLTGDIKDKAYDDFQKNHYDNFDDSWEYSFISGSPDVEFVGYEEIKDEQ